jgi:hypothetical protein
VIFHHHDLQSIAQGEGLGVEDGGPGRIRWQSPKSYDKCKKQGADQMTGESTDQGNQPNRQSSHGKRSPDL